MRTRVTGYSRVIRYRCMLHLIAMHYKTTDKVSGVSQTLRTSSAV